MLTEPIVEGAYYLHKNGGIIGPMARNRATVHYFRGDTSDLVRRVYLVPTDPAEVVAELRELADQISKARHPHDDLGRGQEGAFDAAADLVAEKLLGGKP